MDIENRTEILSFLNDTADAAKKYKADIATSLTTAYRQAEKLSENVGFWNWLGRNYPNNFSTAELAKQTVVGKSKFAQLQIQGKGYEWDWMIEQQKNTKNMFFKFITGNSPTQPQIDITKIDMVTGLQETYQHKAYTSNNPLELRNTPTNTTVVTNAERLDNALDQGYISEEFQTASEIKDATNKRLAQAKNGQASGTYNVKNVGLTMAKAGLIGCVIGASVETVALYKDWKTGSITDEDYLKNITVAGGHIGTTSAMTSAVMIPIQSSILVAGYNTLVTFPIVFLVGGMLDKLISPCFARGEYRQILNSAKYYTNIEMVYSDFVNSVQKSANDYNGFISKITAQNDSFKQLKNAEALIKTQLSDLYNSI